MDERRTVKLGETYRSFAEAERRVIPIISKCLEGMVSAAKAVDERRVSVGRKEKERLLLASSEICETDKPVVV